jgi:tRNA G18 (ribose-2'-O)-methylase SpoU
VQYLSVQEQIKELKEEYTFIALENINRTHYLSDFNWKTAKKPMIVIGEEGTGIPQEVLELCEAQVEIEQFGSVPSVNAAIAASIAMNDFVTKYQKGLNS